MKFNCYSRFSLKRKSRVKISNIHGPIPNRNLNNVDIYMLNPKPTKYQIYNPKTLVLGNKQN